MRTERSWVTCLLVGTVWAAPTFLEVQKFQQIQPKTPDESLIRELELGELNFLHTTDTHGWLGSHLTQANYDGDWGDFVSFTEKFKNGRVGPNRDVVLVDTGDKHDGNGLSDATTPNGVESTKIFNEQDYDLLTLGNHELYNEENTVLEYYSTANSDKFKHAYVSSNVEFLDSRGEWVPFGSKYRYFETEVKGFRILAFSFMFNFKRANTRARVIPAIETFQQSWFREVVEKYPANAVDVVVVFGHMPITDPENQEINHVHSVLRKYYPETVIQYFGGHSHIRDFAVFDQKSTGLQSGRFAETLGFLSIDGLSAKKPVFSRRYVDFSKDSFAHHLGLSSVTEMATEKGLNISRRLSELREGLALNEVVGYVPETYYMNSKPLTSKHNIYNLLTSKVLPLLKSDQTDESKSRFIIINTGAIRYDLYKGNFTKDTEYIVSPFPNDWKFVQVPLPLAEGVADYLNAGHNLLQSMPPPSTSRHRRPGSCPFIHDPHLRKGYTTQDQFGCDGDDKIHNTELYYEVPNVVQSVELKAASSDQVHLVFYSFIQSDVVRALNELNREKRIGLHEYTDSDCQSYGGAATKELLKDYIKAL